MDLEKEGLAKDRGVEGGGEEGGEGGGGEEGERRRKKKRHMVRIYYCTRTHSQVPSPLSPPPLLLLK